MEDEKENQAEDGKTVCLRGHNTFSQPLAAGNLPWIV